MKKTVARLSLLILLAALILPVRAEEPVVLRSRIDRYEGIYATYTYDPQGHLIREELSWGDVTEYELYSSGKPRKSTTTDRDGKLLEVRYYDRQGNVTAVQQRSGRGELTLALRIQNSYDAEGRLTERHEISLPDCSGQRDRFTYTEDGGYSREYTLYYRQGDQILDHIRYTQVFDAAGHMTARYQDLEYGMEVDMSYEEIRDGDGRIIAIHSRSYAPGSYDYRTETARTYDDRGGLLAETVHTLGEREHLSTTAFHTYANTYDAEGRLIKAVRTTQTTVVEHDGTVRTGEAREDWTAVYGYDAEGRLVLQQEGPPDWPDFDVRTWTYDSWGNLQNHSQNGETLEEYIYVPLSQAQ